MDLQTLHLVKSILCKVDVNMWFKLLNSFL